MGNVPSGLELFFGRRINTAMKLLLGSSTGFPRFLERKLGVCAQSQQFFTALKEVLDAPALDAAGGYKKK